MVVKTESSSRALLPEVVSVDVSWSSATSELTSPSEMSPRAAFSLLFGPPSSSLTSRQSPSVWTLSSSLLDSGLTTFLTDSELLVHKDVFCMMVCKEPTFNGREHTPFRTSLQPNLNSFSGGGELSSTSRNGRWKTGWELVGLFEGWSPASSITSRELSACFGSKVSSFCIIIQITEFKKCTSTDHLTACGLMQPTLWSYQHTLKSTLLPNLNHLEACSILQGAYPGTAQIFWGTPLRNFKFCMQIHRIDWKKAH